jgi:fibronectin type 3 domain-containing protein
MLLAFALICLPDRADAYNGGLLENASASKLTVSSPTNVTNLLYAFDNDTTTYASIKTYQNTITYTFDSPQTVTDILINVSTSMYLKMFDASNNQIYAKAASGSGDVKITLPTPINNVKKVSVISNLTGETKLYEFDVSSTIDLTAPPTPTNFTADQVGHGELNLKWSASSPMPPDFQGYNLYQNGVKINASPLTTTNYFVTGLADNTIYDFVVSAIDKNGNESAKTTAIRYVHDTIAPAAPIGLAIIPKPNQSVLLYWTPNTEPDLDGYNVYLSNVKHNSSLIKTTQYLATGLSVNTNLDFQITAVDTSANESLKSQPVSYYIDTVPPAVPAALNATAGDSSINLNWQAVLDSDLDGYNIYTSTGNKVNVLPVKSNNFTAGNLINGTAYSYYVTSIDVYGNESQASNVVTATPKEIPMPPDQPNITYMYEGNASLTVNWAPAYKADSYDVYLDGVKVNTQPVTATGYTFNGLTNGQSYQVYVVAVNTVGTSSPSVIKTGKPNATAPPLITLNSTLADIVDGVSQWFSKVWPLLAFAIGIPLSFIVAIRIKQLFAA